MEGVSRVLKGAWWLPVLTGGSCLKDVKKLSGKCLECVGKVPQGCLKGTLTVFQGCLQVFLEGVRKVYLKDVFV